MSDQDMKPVSAQTGTYTTLTAVPDARAGGKVPAESGKNVPRVEMPDIEVLAAELNTASRAIGRDLRFQVNMDTGRSVIQVLDRETGEIIRQIPPEKAEPYVAADGAVAVRLFDDLA